jgi:hypothetical protein
MQRIACCISVFTSLARFPTGQAQRAQHQSEIMQLITIDQKRTWWIVSQTDGSIGPETSLFDSVFYYCVLLLPAMANHATHLVKAAGVTENAIRIDGAIKNRIVFNPPAHPSPGLWTICWRTLACMHSRRPKRLTFPITRNDKGDNGKRVATVFFNS